MNPAVYPLLGIVYTVRDPVLLFRVLGRLLVELLVPIYWLSDRLVRQDHERLFQEALTRQGVTRVQPLTNDQRARLQRVVEERAERARRKAEQEKEAWRRLARNRNQQQAQAPTRPEGQGADDVVHRAKSVARTLLWVFTPPPPNAPFLQYYGKKLLNLPARLLFPAGYRLLRIRDPAEYAASELAPYLELKGVRSPQEQQALAWANRVSFRSFGVVAYALGFVPLLSWLLNFTITVGAALWAADLERQHVDLLGGVDKAMRTGGGAPLAHVAEE